jgi:hypothetical protein
LGKEVFQAQGGTLGCSVEKKLVESLVRLKLLAEEKLDPFLVRLKLLLEGRMAGSLVRLDLKHVEERSSPQFGSPRFPLQLISRG